MVAGERQLGNDHLGRPGRRERACRQGVAHDAVVHLRVKRAIVERDAGAAGAALLAGLAEADADVGAAVAVGILQGDQEAARRRRVVAVVAAAPGVDVDHSVRRDDQVSGVADIVGKHGCAEPGRQRDPAVVIRAGLRPRCLGAGLRVRERASQQQQPDNVEHHRGSRRSAMTVTADIS